MPEKTEWDEILENHGIIPKEPEDAGALNDLIDESVEKLMAGPRYEEMTLDELAEFEDEEDDRVLESFRQERLAQLRALAGRPRFGSVVEISKPDYVDQVNKAPTGVFVVVHLYRSGVRLSNLMTHHLRILAPKFPHTKFVSIVSTNCVQNYPDANLPTLFVYQNDKLVKQLTGPLAFGGSDFQTDHVEWVLDRAGALKSALKRDPFKRKPVRDVLQSSLKASRGYINSSSDDNESDRESD